MQNPYHIYKKNKTPILANTVLLYLLEIITSNFAEGQNIMIIRETSNTNVNEILRYLDISISDAGIGLTFEETPNLNGSAIRADGNHISIQYSQLSCLFRALGRIKENSHLNRYTIEENYDFDTCGIMIDCSRNAVPSIEFLKDVIRKLALMGHNTLMLYTEDTFEVNAEPYFGYMRGRYTTKELRTLDEYASGFGISIIPCIQTLAHFTAPMKWTKYKELIDINDILLIDDRSTYEFIEKLIASCRKFFTGTRINIGMDEAHLLGRGRYFDKHGIQDKTQIIKRHLAKVTTICEKYGFRPMIWGDMFFRLVNNGEYYLNDSFTPILTKSIPDSVDFIYWDYYAKSKKVYTEMIRAHKMVGDNVIFAGGGWRWTGHTPSLFHSMRVSEIALDACREEGIKEVFITLWGDDGGEASLYTTLPVMQLYAEKRFNDRISDEYLSERFKTCTNGNLKDFYKLDLPDHPTGRHDKADNNPSKYLLYQDLMLGLFDKHVFAGFNKYYDETAQTIAVCSERNPKYAYAFDTLAALCKVLMYKSELGVKIKEAYDAGDKNELSVISSKVIPELICNIEKFRDSMEQQWFTENKPFGFEIIDIRIGGLLQRVKSSKKRLEKYILGEITKIEELEENRLPYDDQANEKTIFVYLWKHIVSASNL